MKALLCVLVSLASVSAPASADFSLTCNGDTAEYGEINQINVSGNHILIISSGPTDFGVLRNTTADQGSLYVMQSGAQITIPGKLLNGSVSGGTVFLGGDGGAYETIYCSR